MQVMVIDISYTEDMLFFRAMLFSMAYTPQQCYFMFECNATVYITLTPSYANLSYAMSSGKLEGVSQGIAVHL